MPQMSQVLREHTISMLTAWMSTKAVAREFIDNFSTISRLQCCFREFVSTSNRLHNRRPRLWRCVGERYANVNVVNTWWGCNTIAQRYIAMPFILRHCLMFQHDNTLSHVTLMKTQRVRKQVQMTSLIMSLERYKTRDASDMKTEPILPDDWGWWGL